MRRERAVFVPSCAVALIAFLAGACSKAADVDEDTDIDTEGHVFDLAGPCPADELVGGFEVASRDTGAVQYAVVSGAIADSVNWNTTGALVGTEGACSVYEFFTWACDPACTGGQICDDQSACVSAPLNLDWGTVRVTGLTAPVEMEPNSSYAYQFQDIENPPFVAGQRILLGAEGGSATAPLLLDGMGVTPLEVPSPDVELVDAEEMQVTWTPADDAAGEISGEFMIDQHGASKRWIFCTWDDTGAGVVPASLASLLCDDWTGLPSFATANLYRRTVDSAETAFGCAELRVLSQAKLNLTFDCPQP
jgi:hypothetical protein